MFRSRAAAGVCTVTNTCGVWTVNLLAVGGCSIKATQSGNAIYSAASNVFQDFLLHFKAQSITFPAISARVYAGRSIALSAAATSGLPVSFASTTPAICTVSDTGGAWSANLLRGGPCTIMATQAGGAAGGTVYPPALAVSQTFDVARLAQTITFPAIAEPVHAGSIGDAGCSSPLGPGSELCGGASPAICTVTETGGVWTINLIAVGQCSVEAQQSGNALYTPHTVPSSNLLPMRAGCVVERT